MSNKKYLTVHGHFYQPPRENPWLEFLELQESAFPAHDWNERVAKECYCPNSVSKIVDGSNKILDIVNNYEFMSFNFGPTLLSWLEKFCPDTYERIIDADKKSVEKHNGHGNAIAQVYNHIIMPLAAKEDKYLQTVWGIHDFKKRFGRMPEGMWLAETACDDETLGVLADCGIKFTILSPHQAKSFRKIGDRDFIDVSGGNIDTTVPYVYNIKSRPGKYIVLFFYNAQISQAVAFEELLTDSKRLVDKLKTGVNNDESLPRLTNIATDGESYGHHTKFGDMALAYAMKVRADEEGFTFTNYGEFLSLEEPHFEVEIKPVSAWSCSHGVGRWKEDCGCSTGGLPGWNQKWRKPLRKALDTLRDFAFEVCEENAPSKFNDFHTALQEYIDVILSRTPETQDKFIEKFMKKNLSEKEISDAFKLLEIRRFSQLMYTSCGWFFNELSGIETVQILKYACRVIQLLKDFSDNDIEKTFTEILDKAQSNIKSFGTGKDIYENIIKPSEISLKNIAALWAITAPYKDYDKISTLYCYEIEDFSTKIVEKGSGKLLIGKINVKSLITLDQKEFVIALLQYSEEDFHCAVKEALPNENYDNLVKELTFTFNNASLTEIIRMLDDNFGRDYFTFKDIFVDERKNIVKKIFQSRTDRFAALYKDVYNEGKSILFYLKDFGITPPKEFKVAAQYVLSRNFNELFDEYNCLEYESTVQNALDILEEAKYFELELDKIPTEQFFSDIISDTLFTFTENFDTKLPDKILKYFGYADLLKIKLDTSKTRIIYFDKIHSKFAKFIQKTLANGNMSKIRDILMIILKIGEKLNINTEFYQNTVSKASSAVLTGKTS